MVKNKSLLFFFSLILLAAAFFVISKINKKNSSIDLFYSQSSSILSEKRNSQAENGLEQSLVNDKGHRQGALSLDNFAKKNFQGSNFKIGRVLDNNNSYARYYITYRSDGNIISGIMNVPKGRGPFPVLILGHGYIDPSVYTNGRGLKREQDYLAKQGYVVVHPDYRGHAQSDSGIKDEEDLTFGYAEDVINVILALKEADLTFADTNRIGMLGHSMGGGIALQVAVTRPDLLKALVLFAPVSSDAWDNYIQWQEQTDQGKAVIQKYGTLESNPGFWRGVSSGNYFDKIQSPVLIEHGDADQTVPLEWSEKTIAALKSIGKSAEIDVYPGESHEFASAWPTVMKKTVDFFDENI